MSDVDPEKLKVAELRDELKNRGLDTKGNKAALVARLKEAILADAEVEQEDEVELVEGDEQGAEDAEEEQEPEAVQEAEEPMTVEDEPAVEAEAPVEAAPVEGEAAKEGEAAAATGEEEQQEQNGDGEEEVVLGEEFQTIDEASQDDTEEGNTDRKRKRSRSPRDRHRRSRSRERYRRSRSPHERRRHSPPPRKVDMDDTSWESLTSFVLDRYDCDLNLRFDDNNVKAHPLTVDGFAYMWSGVRAMFGIKSGKVAYEVKVLENLNVDHLPRDEPNPHVVRVGWSINSTSLNLGEEEFSYGYGGTGKSSTACKFNEFGEKFGPGDVITAYLDMDSDPVTMSYSKNGEDLGTCFEVEKEKLGDNAMFPHVMTKNTEFECNFGAKDESHFTLKDEYVFLEKVAEEDRVRGVTPPATKEECQVIMMVGLPGTGKTCWAQNHVKENPDSRFNVLGTNNIIDKMKVMGLPRKENYGGRWYVLIDKATKCLNRMIEVAARKKRNYILDQTNVYASARRRKMQPFEGFQRKAIVVLPSDEEFKNRVKQRTEDEKKDVPDSAVLEMKANFILPEESNGFGSIEFTEDSVAEEEREKLIEQYRKEGRDALPPPDKRYRGSDRFSGARDWRGGGDRRGGYRGGYDRDRRGGSFRGRGFNNNWRPSYHDRRGGGGGYRGAYRDDRRRDDRSSGYKGRGGGGGGWRGGNSGGWGGNQYNQGWGYNQGGYNQGWGGYNQGGWGGYNQGYNQSWGNYGYR